MMYIHSNNEIDKRILQLQPFNGLFSRTTWVSRYQKGKTNLDFTEARDSEWQCHQLGHMQVCTSLQTDNMPVPHHSVFYRPDALPAAQPTASEHWRQKQNTQQKYEWQIASYSSAALFSVINSPGRCWLHTASARHSAGCLCQCWQTICRSMQISVTGHSFHANEAGTCLVSTNEVLQRYCSPFW